jgi:hypothetical protein
MSGPFNIIRLWRNFTGNSKSNPVNIVAQRFLQVFREHGVETSQIPRLLPAIGLDDLKSEESLLTVLTPEILDKSAKLFGIRSQWLEGVDDRIYEWLSCYKQPEIFFEHLASLKEDQNDYDFFYVQTLTTTKNLNRHDESEQLLTVIVSEKIAELGDERIYRYHVYGDGWDWPHWHCRIQLKTMARLLYTKFGRTMPLYTTKQADLMRIREGRQIPRSYLGGCLISEPSLEDFALSASQSVIAKDMDELPAVLEYIEQHKLKSLIDSLQPKATTDNQLEEKPVDVTVTNNASKAANVKHARINAIKEKFISFYQAESMQFRTIKAAAGHFFDLLDEKQEQLMFTSRDTAIRTLQDALRDFRKSSNSSR